MITVDTLTDHLFSKVPRTPWGTGIISKDNCRKIATAMIGLLQETEIESKSDVDQTIKSLIPKGVSLDDVTEFIWDNLERGAEVVGDVIDDAKDALDDAKDAVEENIPFSRAWFRKRIKEWGGVVRILAIGAILIAAVAFFILAKSRGVF